MKTLLVSGVLSFAAVVGSAPALAQSGSYIVHNTIYYDSPSHGTEVGFLIGRCGRYGPQYTLHGVQTPYSEEVEAGVCVDGVFEPL